jgi:hypothetical protein
VRDLMPFFHRNVGVNYDVKVDLVLHPVLTDPVPAGSSERPRALNAEPVMLITCCLRKTLWSISQVQK